jgi:hypothetical protein
MARLPVPGSDRHTWGTILNDFLSVEFNTDGTLRKSQLIDSKYVKPIGGIPEADLDTGTQAKINAVANGGVASVNNRSGHVTLSKTDVGLDNVDNTADIDKPISTAVQTALENTLSVESYDGTPVQLKLIALADGSVRAVPVNAQPPIAPTNLAVDIHLSFVELTWDAVPGASYYRLYRDSAYITNRSVASYADANVTLNGSYTYTVQAVDSYSVWGPQSAPITATIDASINSSPTLASITIWPTNPRPTDKVYVHVNAADVDAHSLAVVLNTDAGTLTPTFDPTTWIWSET